MTQEFREYLETQLFQRGIVRVVGNCILRLNKENSTGRSWISIPSIYANKYGLKSSMSASRAALMLRLNTTSLNYYQLACHLCKHEECINPAHIYLGNAKTNAVDSTTAIRRRQIKNVMNEIELLGI